MRKRGKSYFFATFKAFLKRQSAYAGSISACCITCTHFFHSTTKPYLHTFYLPVKALLFRNAHQPRLWRSSWRGNARAVFCILFLSFELILTSLPLFLLLIMVALKDVKNIRNEKEGVCLFFPCTFFVLLSRVQLRRPA